MHPTGTARQIDDASRPAASDRPGQAVAPPPRASTLRRVSGAVAVAGMLPYLVLKTLWLSGWNVGVLDQATLGSPTMEAVNGATLGMEAVAVVVALTLTRPWGLRLPAWLIVFPVWVAAGFLVPRLTTKPLASLLVNVSGTAPHRQPLIAPWVYVVVSLGFAIQGIALLVAFVSYCHARWGTLLRRPMSGWRTATTGPLAAVAVRASAGIVALVAGLRAVAVVVAVPEDRPRLAAAAMSTTVWVLVALAGALPLARRSTSGRRARTALAMVAVGTGAMVWWGVFKLITVMAGAVVAGDIDSPLSGIATLGDVCIGLVIALAAAFAIAEEASG